MNKEPIPIPKKGLKLGTDPKTPHAFYAGIQGDLDDTKKLVKYGFIVLLVMVATLVIMVANMVIDSWVVKTESYYNLVEKISAIDSKVNLAIPNKKQ